MGMQLKRAGHDDFVIFERSPGVGGTWHDNRYPGAACDVPSHLYTFSFAPNADWTHKFSRQPEIERYLQRCVDDHDLGKHFRLGTEVVRAEHRDRWHIATSTGDDAADILVSGTGPAQPAADSRVARPRDVRRRSVSHGALEPGRGPSAGKRVIVIGCGASAVQIVPELVRDAAHVTVMQRTPA